MLSGKVLGVFIRGWPANRCQRLFGVMNKAKVIAVSGASGAGKTAVVEQLSKVFACPVLKFDDFVEADTYPADMKKWLLNGARTSEIKTPKLVAALRELAGQCRCDYIFLEEPFGYGRDALAPLIDRVVLLDPPMEICLSRLIQRNISNPSVDSLISIPGYLAKYDDYLRECYLECVNQIRSHCNLVVQAHTSVEQTTKVIADWLQSQAR